jgi:CelD/BcsL family acetyltransferase involved in cellulose biosynthesis
MPVMVRPSFRGVALPVLRSWMHDYCFLGTPLVSAHDDAAQIWTTIRYELQRSCRVALLVMQVQAHHGPVAAALRAADAQVGLGVGHSPVTFRGFAHRRFAPTYAGEWMARRHLANLARRRRRLNQMLGVPIGTVDRTVVGLGKAIEEFLQLEASGWKGRSGTALLCRPAHDRFFREVSQGFAEQGRLMFLSLQAGTRVLSQSTALIGGHGLFGFKKAYDETLARWSPGTLLDLDVLGWFHQMRQLHWIDTCSTSFSEAAPDGDLFGDRRAICTLLLPVSPVGRPTAALLSTSMRAQDYLRRSSARRSQGRPRSQHDPRLTRNRRWA